ncbi:MAG: copper chaperone PCu(A)C [Azospirillaceae bacterium]|nr:copper chaperone PCu(A)C [Azospirillaceae bacterium]
MLCRFIATVMAVALLAAVPARAETFKAGSIEITDPWARATIAAASAGAAYLEIRNHGTAPDHLIAASTPVAAEAQLHMTTISNGVAGMRPVETLEIVAGTSTRLAPGGLHIMLMGLKGPLEKGKSFPLTLTFEKAGSLTVPVTIEGPGAGGAGMMAPMDHSMMGAPAGHTP